ncbi:ribosomal protein S6 kinase alpha-1/2/3/6 [Paragonimus westermani]|uniref:Ribosomal protein S6 kinase alpha-1/2/3/6 n=1 Tax=Paragonimus westermani TaxID=34504 RepID=A0A5J4NXL0_9TREM|nr:ribosomal protein S6 kinase alpha-1/2/3/6 [Paragonimus westermani]
MTDQTQPFTNVDVKDFSCFSQRIEPSHFQLLRVLGQGSFGKVFLVRKRVGADAGTLFAMKVLRKASLKQAYEIHDLLPMFAVRDRIRTKLERDILAAIHHPFIVRLEYAFQTEGRLYLILEYLRGGDLFSRLSKEVALSEIDVRFYLAELILALNHLHQLGIIYRDLKPENILLDTDGHIKLTDFGLSKEAVDKGRTFSFCGTVEYMAPEVITRRGHDASADWWSLGVVMFEMLCGVLPFQGESRRETMQQILRAKLRMPQFLSLEAQSLLRALFKRNPCSRLGYGANGLIEFKEHPFFAAVPWSELLERSVTAPYRPNCSPTSGPNVAESISDSTSLNESPDIPTSTSVYEVFAGFSYTAPNLAEHFSQSPNHFLPDGCQRTARSSTCSSLNEDIQCSPESLGSVKSVPNPINLLIRKSQNARPTLYNSEPKIACSSSNQEPLENCADKEKAFGAPTFARSPTVSDLKKTKKTTFADDYELRELINRDTYFTCRRCVHRRTFEVRTMKILDKRLYDPSNEIKILKQFQHLDNVVKLYEAIYGNLKSSNLFYAGLDQNPNSLRFCDFRFATQQHLGQRVITQSSYAHGYAAPEVLRGKEMTYSCDMWSLGILLSIMLVGRAPYSHRSNDTPSAVLSRMEDEESVQLVGSWWDVVSIKAKDLVLRLLQKDSEKRITAADVLSHEWIRNRHELSRQVVSGVTTLSSANKTVLPVRTTINPAVPTLEPVTASQLAVRRQQSRVRTSVKTFTICPTRPINTYSECTRSSPMDTRISSVTMQWPGNPHTHSFVHTYTQTAQPKPKTAPGGYFSSSTTFTLGNNDKHNHFFSPNRGSLSSQPRIVV